MSTLGQLKASSEKILAVGRDKVLAMRRGRRQQTLLTQLGRACYDERSGRSDGKVEIEQLVSELSLLDESDALDEAKALDETVDDTRAVETV